MAARWTAAGTQSGAWGDVEATGKRVRFSGVNIFRFGGGGKVIEIWNHRDDLGSNGATRSVRLRRRHTFGASDDT